MTKERLDLGKKGEDIALEIVKRLGYKCLARNYRCTLGEIDLIAREGECLVFIEIKTRKDKSTGFAKEAVDSRKRRQISRVALSYMKENDCSEMSARFDVIAINLSQGDMDVEIINNAFELEY